MCMAALPVAMVIDSSKKVLSAMHHLPSVFLFISIHAKGNWLRTHQGFVCFA